MKIKIWAFVLCVAGALLVGGVVGFAAFGGLTAADRVLQDIRQIKPNAGIQAPDAGNGGNNNKGIQPRAWNFPGNMPGFGKQQAVPIYPALPSGLPQGFNAGVNIESEYAALTGQTVEQVQAKEEKADTDVWGLARSEGKLDELKTKVSEDVSASLKQMVTDGKITQAQSDSYYNWVNQYLKAVGQTKSAMMPGRGWRNHRYGANGGIQPGGNTQPAPEATATPGAIASPGATATPAPQTGSGV